MSAYFIFENYIFIRGRLIFDFFKFHKVDQQAEEGWNEVNSYYKGKTIKNNQCINSFLCFVQ